MKMGLTWIEWGGLWKCDPTFLFMVGHVIWYMGSSSFATCVALACVVLGPMHVWVV